MTSPAIEPTVTTTTAKAIDAFHTELLNAGIPAPVADHLTEAAGVQLLQDHGLTVNVPLLDGSTHFLTLGRPSQHKAKACRCAPAALQIDFCGTTDAPDAQVRDAVRRWVRRAE